MSNNTVPCSYEYNEHMGLSSEFHGRRDRLDALEA